jgi:hypothetical protein
MSLPWFDPTTGALLLDQQATDHASFKNILADGVVTDAELAEQSQRVLGLLRALEKRLPPELHELTTEALTELAVLHAVQAHYHRQQAAASGQP